MALGRQPGWGLGGKGGGWQGRDRLWLMGTGREDRLGCEGQTGAGREPSEHPWQPLPWPMGKPKLEIRAHPEGTTPVTRDISASFRGSVAFATRELGSSPDATAWWHWPLQQVT